MAAPLSKNYEVTTVRAAANLVAATPSTTSYVKCRGAKAVHFVVYSTTAAENSAFTEPDLSVRVDTTQGEAATITAPATGAGAYGVVAPNAAACVTAGDNGYCLSVYPDQPGTEVAAANLDFRIMGVDEIALVLGPHATEDIGNVVVKAIVEF